MRIYNGSQCAALLRNGSRVACSVCLLFLLFKIKNMLLSLTVGKPFSFLGSDK